MKLKEIESIKYNRTKEELQLFIIFAICVAGKTATQIVKALNKFFPSNISPFNHLRSLEKSKTLDLAIRNSSLGQHNKLGKAFRYLINNDINLVHCSIEELEAIPGCGPKTSRFFLSFNRPNVNYAILDTHILAEMRELGHDVPKSTPQSRKRYKEIEATFVSYAQSLNKTPAELDLEIWLKRSRSRQQATTVME